jgi:hypothetical protein
MSKGDRHRSINDKFKSNFDKIKWSGESKYANKRRQTTENKSARVWADIEPYQAVGGDAAGSWITSRSKHREYLKRNNCIEVGNEKDYFFRHDGKSPDNPTKDWGRDD